MRYGIKNRSVYLIITKFPGDEVKVNVWCRFENSDEKFKKDTGGPERLEMVKNERS